MFRIVLIDDETLVLKGMSIVLKKDPNIQLVGTASTGREGLDLIYRERPDIVLTDIRMPGMTGLEMIEKAQERFPDIAYIIFSGFNEFKYVQKAIGLGVLDYLEKYKVSNMIDTEYPPCFIVHCKDDSTVPYENSVYLHDRLKEYGIRTQLKLGEKGEHGFGDGRGTDVEGWPEEAIKFLESL